MPHEIASLVEISKKIGARPDYVQGGGGNTSVKISANEMHIKASGFRLSDMSLKKGFVGVDHKKIAAFYSSLDGSEDASKLNSANDRAVKKSVLDCGGDLRPSIETGFHTLAGKYVIHTHSVYANILNCSVDGQSILEKLFKDSVSVPYYPPGAALTLGVKNALSERDVGIFFLKNHGVVVSGDTARNAHILHELITRRVKEKLKIESAYPRVCVTTIKKGSFKSSSFGIKAMMKRNREIVENFSRVNLFPDQVVYGDDVGFAADAHSGIRIDVDKGTIIYDNTTYNKALTFEEVFISWLYIVDQIRRLGMVLNPLTEAETFHIANMESEKYRKTLT
jgi:ribulose-5-phosphate 4-epimerase/fuculose-1-phosphate aldolase